MLHFTLVQALLAATAHAGAHRIEGPAFGVDLAETGVILGAPSAGLSTVDGPKMHLGARPIEWYGLTWLERGELRACSGSGLRDDWAHRAPIEIASCDSSRGLARVCGVAGSLAVETDFSFEPDGSHLIVAVRITNRSDRAIDGLIYTREAFDASGEGWTFPDVELGGELRDAPRSIRRRVWALGSLASGASAGLAFALGVDLHAAPSAIDVPLSLWTDANFPNGLDFGQTNGVSWGDYDADGYPDVFACQARKLWKNVGGQTWTFAANVPFASPGPMYGSSFADFDQDGWPDFVTEPRFGPINCLRLMRNVQGTTKFRDIALDPWLVDTPACQIYSETACWADVDDDGYLDVFLPVYPPWIVSPPRTNFFYHSRGPSGPLGQFAFTEASTASGLDNPPGTSRPEGAQFADVDDDGDLDLFSNGTLYQNRSTHGAPHFAPLAPTTSGISIFDVLDEGAVFGDYDMDGDLDLFTVYSFAPGVTIWENQGDGTFFQAEAGIVQSPMIGLDLGISLEDWDNDGDLDLTTRGVFRRNQLAETGTRLFTVATTNIDPTHITSATPAWCDWDKDGDLDCALGNWSSVGHFYRNDLYDASTAAIDRRYVRVRPLRANPNVAGGMESEFGAKVELHLVVGDDGRRHVKFTSSSAGYLNQNEYTLTFGLPANPPDVVFDVSVDFPSTTERGILRVDQRVNPALAGIHLAALVNRQIDVFRDGTVQLEGVNYPPLAGKSAWLASTSGGLALASDAAPLAPLQPAPFSDAWIVLGLSTLRADAPVHLEQIDLDGALDQPVTCAANPFDVGLWDVTDPAHPSLAPNGALNLATSARNHRTHFVCDLTLQPKREYRLAARVTAFRASTVSAKLEQGPLIVRGGALVQDVQPCSALSIASVALDPHLLYLAARTAQ